MKKRNPWIVFLLNIITLELYSIYWLSATTDELNDEGAKIPSSWFMFIPLVNIWWLWKYARGVEQVTVKKSKNDLKNYGFSTVGAFFLLLLLDFIALPVLQSAYNKQAKDKKHYYSKISAWTKAVAYLALVSAIFLGSFWYTNDYNTSEKKNERMFWSAIENSLTTPSVMKTTQSGASGKLDTNQQLIYNSGERLVHTNYITEVNNPAQSFELTVRTEALQYYSGDNFIRYTEYSSTDETSLGEYVGLWASQSSDENTLEDYQIQYASGLVSVVLFADLNPSLRASVLEDLKDAYQVNTRDVLFNTVDGEDLAQVTVSLKLREYIDVLNQVFAAQGYPDLGISSQDAGEGTLDISVEIRTKDNTIARVIYGSVDEQYSNYGVVSRPERPLATLTYQELQQAVQKRLADN